MNQSENRFYRTPEMKALQELVETGRSVQITKEGDGYTVAIALARGGWMSSHGESVSQAAGYLWEAWPNRSDD